MFVLTKGRGLALILLLVGSTGGARKLSQDSVHVTLVPLPKDAPNIQ